MNLRKAPLAFILMCLSSHVLADDYSNKVTDKKEQIRQIAAFQQTMRKMNRKGEILSCTNMIKVSEGRFGYIWGAHCTLKEDDVQNPILICDDDFAGGLQIEYTIENGYEPLLRFMSQCGRH